jgi:hypothetical protein
MRILDSVTVFLVTSVSEDPALSEDEGAGIVTHLTTIITSTSYSSSSDASRVKTLQLLIL